MKFSPTRRSLLGGLSAAAVAGLVNVRPSFAEPPPETTTVRLPRWYGDAPYCWAALYIARELLSAEGFTVQDVEGDTGVDNSMWLANGQTDFDVNMPSMQILLIEAGVPLKILTGLHTGCFELVANKSVLGIADLHGKTIGVNLLGDHPHLLTELMVSYVGLDPKRDIQWVETAGKTMEFFINGKIDAFLAGPPLTLELRAQKIGHTILNNGVDRPWSQYFCCTIAGSTDYVTKYPIATKRVLRAILKAADLCASDAPLAARRMVDGGYVPRYDYALQTLNDLGYGIWRDYDVEDSVRFYALRMQETGMIKSSPQKIITDGTDWRFLNELKRELKS